MAKDTQAESVLSKVTHELAALEKRDLELWLIVTGTGILVGVGFLALIFPAAILEDKSVHLEMEVSRQLFVGLMALLILFNTYVITRRLDLRRTREALISTTIQGELARLQSFTDPLTEVYNRRSLDEMAEKYMKHARRIGKPLSFMVLDADRFKEVNTRFGHLTGDFVIAELASLLRAAVRGCDAVIRYGGDEFLIILADAPLAGAKEVAARVAKFIDEWNRGGHLDNFVMTVSIGLAEWSDGKSLDDVLNEADQKMYAAKAQHNPPA